VEELFSEKINEVLVPAVKQNIVSHLKRKFSFSEGYRRLANEDEKKALMRRETQKMYQGLNQFKLSFYVCYALGELVARERKIQAFIAKDYYKVWAQYRVDGVEFVAFYPSPFDEGTIKEMEDLMADLRSKNFEHIVDHYEYTEKEKQPPEPITTAQMQFSAFYIYDIPLEESKALALKLYGAGLITYPITDGWNIEDDVAEEIISHLNGIYENDPLKVTQYKRQFEDKKSDRSIQAAIRPTKFMSEYKPENIKLTKEFQSMGLNPREEANALSLYDYIYRFTLATQMAPALYDRSIVQIAVGPRILKQSANTVVEEVIVVLDEMNREQRKTIVHDGWENIAGKLYKKRENATNGFEENEVVLPKLKDGKTLAPLNVQRSIITSKRPPRFGAGRYVVQVLAKYGIGNPDTYDSIITQLTSAKLVTLSGKMLIPNEIALIAYDWLEKYAPDLTKIEQMKYYEDKWNAVYSDELTEESVILEFESMLEKAVSESGYIAEDSAPTENKIKLVKATAAKHRLTLTPETLNSNLECDKILLKYPPPEEIKIGQCPKCNANVFQREWINQETGETSHYFICENTSSKLCNFSIWDNEVHKFFSDKQKELYTLKERAEMLSKILSKQRNKEKGFRVDALVAKNKSTYNARVFMEPYVDKKTQKEKWGFGLDFINSRGGR